MGYRGGGRRAVMDAFKQPGIPHPAHGVRGDGVSAYFVEQVRARAGGVDQGQQAIGAVLIEEIVIKVLVLNFPGMGQQGVNLLLVEIQGVLPEIPVFDVVVQPDHFVIGLDGGNAWIAPENTPIGKQQLAVMFSGIGCVGNSICQQQIGFFVILGGIEPQEGVSEHG